MLRVGICWCSVTESVWVVLSPPPPPPKKKDF
jgi:hypothetical protein